MTLNSPLILWWAVGPVASVGSPRSTSEAKHLFFGLLPTWNLSSVDVPCILPSLLPWLLTGFLWDPGKVCWASICLILTVASEKEDQAEIKGNSAHQSPPVAVTASSQAATLSFSCEKSFSLTILFTCHAGDGARGLVHVRQVQPLRYSPILTALKVHFNSAPTLLCNLHLELFHPVKLNFCPHGNKALYVTLLGCCWPAFCCPSLWTWLLQEPSTCGLTQSSSLCVLYFT